MYIPKFDASPWTLVKSALVGQALLASGKHDRKLETCANDAFINSPSLLKNVIGNYIYYPNSTLNYGDPINTWCVGELTSMYDMFSFKETFNEDINGWDVSKVTDMQFMFSSARAFNQDLSGWNLSKVTTMRYMFLTAVAFNQDLCAWGRYYKESTDYRFMWQDTSCPVEGDPFDEKGFWCRSFGALNTCPALQHLYTSRPTSAPTVQIPWKINFINLFANFTFDEGVSRAPEAEDAAVKAATTNVAAGEAMASKGTAAGATTAGADAARATVAKIELNYDVGKGRDLETFIYQKDCTTNITDVGIIPRSTRSNKDAKIDLLTLEYNIGGSDIASSSIWNATTNKIEICHIVNLITPAADSLPKMIIVEDVLEAEIDFDLSVDYFVDNELGAGTTEAAVGETNVSSYLEVCKCKAVDDFTCDPAALVPNTQLYVCIKSVSSDVEIKQLVSMVVTQGAAFMDVIVAGVVKISSIADLTYVETKNGVVVSTFVPTNKFNYATGASINITGGIDTQLVGSARKLLANKLDGAAFNANGDGQTSYELEVPLQDGVIVLGDEGALMGSSGAAVVNGAAALLGTTFLFACGV